MKPLVNHDLVLLYTCEEERGFFVGWHLFGCTIVRPSEWNRLSEQMHVFRVKEIQTDLLHRLINLHLNKFVEK